MQAALQTQQAALIPTGGFRGPQTASPSSSCVHAFLLRCMHCEHAPHQPCHMWQLLNQFRHPRPSSAGSRATLILHVADFQSCCLRSLFKIIFPLHLCVIRPLSPSTASPACQQHSKQEGQGCFLQEQPCQHSRSRLAAWCDPLSCCCQQPQHSRCIHAAAEWPTPVQERSV